MKNIFIIFVASILLNSCYTTQDIKISSGFRQLVVDGMVVFDPKNPFKAGGDEITLSYTTEYASSDSLIPYITNAIVTLKDSIGNSETLENKSNGKYITKSLVIRPAMKYILDIKLADGETYTAKTYTPIKFGGDFKGLPQTDTCRKSGTPIGPIPAGAFVDFNFYDDPSIIPDFYWFKPYVKRITSENSPYNSVLGINVSLGLNTILGVNTVTGIEDKYSEWRTFRGSNKILLAVDFSNGRQNSEPFEQSEKTKLILPLRLNVTMSSVGAQGADYPFYFPGDSLKVKVFAVTPDHISFLSAVAREISNGSGGGLSGLFSRPPSNTPTNIINNDKNGKKAVGWFGGGWVVEKSTRINLNARFIKDQNNSKTNSSISCP